MKLDYKKTLLLGFGFLGISLIWSVYNSYMPIFLREYSDGLDGIAHSSSSRRSSCSWQRYACHR